MASHACGSDPIDGVEVHHGELTVNWVDDPWHYKKLALENDG